MNKNTVHYCQCINWLSRAYCKMFNKPGCTMERTWDRVSERPSSSIGGDLKYSAKKRANWEQN